MRATLALTSCCAAMTSAPSSICRRTSEEPSSEVLVTSRIPCTVLSASSIGLLTSRITTSGLAPG